MKTILSRPAAGRPDRDRGFASAWLAGAAAAAVAALAAAAGVPALVGFAAGLGAAGLVGFALRGPAAEGPRTEAGPAESPGPERTPRPEARGVMEALPTPLLVIAESGRVVHANRVARTALPRLAVGAHYAHLIRAPEFVGAVAATMADGGERMVSFATDPARERLLRARISPVPDGGAFGEGARLVVQIEDRTEAHRAEQLRSDFIANASHELRTPLASIIGYIETLQHHARDDPAARERFLAIMEREAGRMQRLVDDLMSLSRIELTEHLRPAEPCRLAEIAAEAASALLPVAQGEGVALEIAPPERSETVPGDRDQLYQVFTNLIDNAIKYAGAGATVRVRAAEPSRAFPNRAGIAVEDTGPGIPREHLPRLTERFYRVNTGQSRNKGGTGLGLAIVKHIINRHAGKLEIVSRPGEGSAFTVWLPRAGAGGEDRAGEPAVTKTS